MILPPVGSFATLEKRLRSERSPGVQAGLIDRFLRTMTYPVLEDDTTALLLFRGDVPSVHLIGDMTDWIDTLPFARVPETDLWYHRGSYEPDARLEYLIQSGDGTPAAADPFNADAVHGFVLNSELAMPRYRRRPVFEEYRHGLTGGFERLSAHVLPAGVLPWTHDVHVYLPTGYGSGDLPVVYFQDGRDYIEYGVAAEVVHRHIEDGCIEPVIAVFVTPPNLHLPAEPNRTTEYGMNDAYVRFFCDELVPWVDLHYRTLREPRGRLVVGDSYGGLTSIYIAFRRPGVFGSACSQSGYLSFQNDRLLRDIDAAMGIAARLFVDIGTYERRVGHGIVPDDEGDFLSANRRFRDAARRHGADLEYREYHEGHTWGNWRAHLQDALAYFFGTGR